MSLPQLPIKTERLVDEQRYATLPYQAFFEDMAAGDLGTAWTPTFVNLTETGTATITGTYYRLSAKLVAFIIVITPATNTSGAANSTYCDNFPLSFSKQGVCWTVSGSAAAPAGIGSDGRIYTGTWTNITTPITILGFGEAQ